MRRSEAKVSKLRDTAELEDPGRIIPGAYCGECGRPQFKSPTGGVVTCQGGHGDAMTVSKAEAEQVASDNLAKLGRGVVTSSQQVLDAFAAANPPTTREQAMKAAGVNGREGRVAKASAELAVEMAHQEEKESELSRAMSDPTRWASAKPAREVPVDPGFQAIVETLWVSDPKGTYDFLEEQLRLGDKRTDRGTVYGQLDDAERNARTAHRLWQTAIVERKRWELENEVVHAAMRTEATKSLQREKEQGLRSKQITDADVESRCAAMFTDEWRAQEVRRTKMKAMVDSMENLSELWLKRIGTLQVLLEKQR